jgi:tight adherence protein C
MPGTVVAGAAAIGLALALLGYAVVARPGASRPPVRVNLTRQLVVERAAPGVPADRRRRGPGRLLRLLTPDGVARRMRRLLDRAGRPPAWPLARLLWAKLVLAGTGATLGTLFVLASPGTLAALLAAVVTGVLYFLPELLLSSRGQERQQAIALELADTLDQMTIAVEAGLGFEAAMARAGRNGTGPLAEELVRTIQDIAVGRPRREAYLGLVERTAVPDLKRFVAAVNQADAYGIAIAGVLRTQADEMRLKRRQRAEEKAMQIPVKVIFPLILFILPTLFIVLLGPAVIDIVGAFSG